MRFIDDVGFCPIPPKVVVTKVSQQDSTEMQLIEQEKKPPIIYMCLSKQQLSDCVDFIQSKYRASKQIELKFQMYQHQTT